MREKLIELLKESNKLCEKTSCALCVGNGKGEDCIEHLTADHLIANGVAVLPNVPIGLVQDALSTDVYCPYCGTNLSGNYGDNPGNIIQCFRCGMFSDNTKILSREEVKELLEASSDET